MSTIPENNLIAYKLMYEIEVGLREFIIVSLGKDDQKWWKRRLPSDVMKKLIDGREKERKIRWVELISHHPLYYIDFPDLKKVIEVGDNWRDIFQKTLGDKDVFCGGLRELEPVRNNLAHNRKVSDSDVFLLRANHSILENAIGKDEWERLILEQTIALSIHEQIDELEGFSKNVYANMIGCSLLASLDIWVHTSNEWWFDDDYLCQDLEPIRDFFVVASEYTRLPRYRGSGHIIEHWVKNHNVDQLFNAAESVFTSLLRRLKFRYSA